MIKSCPIRIIQLEGLAGLGSGEFLPSIIFLSEAQPKLTFDFILSIFHLSDVICFLFFYRLCLIMTLYSDDGAGLCEQLARECSYTDIYSFHCRCSLVYRYVKIFVLKGIFFTVQFEQYYFS